MSDLLTHEEYSAIANSLNFPTNRSSMDNSNLQNQEKHLKLKTLQQAKLSHTLQPAMQMMWTTLLSKQGRRSTKGTGPNYIQVKEKKPS